MSSMEYQRKLIEEVLEGNTSLEDASIYTVLLYLVEKAGYDEVGSALHLVEFDLAKEAEHKLSPKPEGYTPSSERHSCGNCVYFGFGNNDNGCCTKVKPNLSVSMKDICDEHKFDYAF